MKAKKPRHRMILNNIPCLVYPDYTPRIYLDDDSRVWRMAIRATWMEGFEDDIADYLTPLTYDSTAIVQVKNRQYAYHDHREMAAFKQIVNATDNDLYWSWCLEARRLLRQKLNADHLKAISTKFPRRKRWIVPVQMQLL